MDKEKQIYKVLGVMSGTSLDGIDLAMCRLEMTRSTNAVQEWTYALGVAETVPYPADWKTRLQEGIHFSRGRLARLDQEYTYYLGSVISQFIEKHSLDHLDAVCSHGHTILHQPHKGLTLQIGNLSELAQITGQKVVCDFRVEDVKLGGQGAPLVPIGDRLLFGSYDYCLNLGGFANCSFEKGGKRIAYDICPVNIVLNFFSEMLGRPYDDDGKIAANGKVDQAILKQLNNLEFYKQLPPKSLGLEWAQKYIFPILNDSKISEEDKIATFTEHVAIQIAAQFDLDTSILITGGGAYNSFLLERIRSKKKANFVIPDATLLEFKEALVFGLLGVLKMRGEVNCLASVTGAKKDHSGGFIYLP